LKYATHGSSVAENIGLLYQSNFFNIQAIERSIEDVESDQETKATWALDVRGTKKRTVNAVQRLTLDRQFNVALVEAAGVSAHRLELAERILDVEKRGWPSRTWVAIDARTASDDLAREADERRQAIGARLLSVVFYARDDASPTSASVFRELHVRLCADLYLSPGPTVLAGRKWNADAGPDTVRLAPADREVQVEEALESRDLRELLADHILTPVEFLAAVARSGDPTESWADDVGALLRTSSPSIRRAWAALTEGTVDDPATWTRHSREFVSLVIRGLRSADFPIAKLPSNVLSQDYFWDEMLRLAPRHSVYDQLQHLALVSRARIGLVDGFEKVPLRFAKERADE